MLRLHLGVIDQPYMTPPEPGARKARRPAKGRKRKGKAQRPKRQAKGAGTATTGDVAGILEAKYAVMEYFAERNLPAIAEALENGLAGSLENLLMGRPPSADPFAGGTSVIEELFKRFIESGGMNGQPGVPTKAAIQRRSLRFKSRYAKSDRPSFIDTGLYVDSFKSWMESQGA